jgi:hypothetical protein
VAEETKTQYYLPKVLVESKKKKKKKKELYA